MQGHRRDRDQDDLRVNIKVIIKLNSNGLRDQTREILIVENIRPVRLLDSTVKTNAKLTAPKFKLRERSENGI